MLKKENRIIQAESGFKQTFGICSVGRISDKQTRHVRKETFNILTVIQTTANITTHRNSDYSRRFEQIIGAVTHHYKLITHLHKSRPDVIAELNFDTRFYSCNCHPNSNTHYACFSQGGIE